MTFPETWKTHLPRYNVLSRNLEDLSTLVQWPFQKPGRPIYPGTTTFPEIWKTYLPRYNDLSRNLEDSSTPKSSQIELNDERLKFRSSEVLKFQTTINVESWTIKVEGSDVLMFWCSEERLKLNEERWTMRVERLMFWRSEVLKFWGMLNVDVERWTLKVERWELNGESWTIAEYRVQSTEYRVQSAEYKVQLPCGSILTIQLHYMACDF